MDVKIENTMTVPELREKLVEIDDAIKAVIDAGEKEERQLTEDETSNLDYLKAQRSAINTLLAESEKENQEIVKEIENKRENKSNKTMEVRLFDLIKEVVNGNVSDEHRQFVQGNNIEFRAPAPDASIQATGNGQENVPTYKQPLELAIRNATVLDKLGVTWFSNAVGDIKLVKYNGSTTEWAESENAEAEDGSSDFSEVLLQPKRVTSYIDISRQFLAQSPEDAEAILIADLSRAIAQKIDETLFGAESGTTYKPAGLFNAADGVDRVNDGEELDNITFDHVLDLEAAVEAHNGTDFVFVTDPKCKMALRGTQMASGLRFVWENGEIDGRKAVVSNSVNPKSILCFDPRDLACASWDNQMVITVDPYTQAKKNVIRVVVNYLFDGKMKGDRAAATVFDEQ